MPSIVSEGLHVTGNMISDGDVQIDGTIEGDVRGRTLTVGVNGKVIGKVEAEEVTIDGTIMGEIVASNVRISKSAKVRGDVAQDALTIESGAEFEGYVRKRDSSAPAKPAAAASTSGGSEAARSMFQKAVSTSEAKKVNDDEPKQAAITK
jgi:cytoskeletal protein CcmA (bactofilin family)